MKISIFFCSDALCFFSILHKYCALHVVHCTGTLQSTVHGTRLVRTDWAQKKSLCTIFLCPCSVLCACVSLSSWGLP